MPGFFLCIYFTEVRLSPEAETACKTLVEHVEQFIQKSAYQNVKLSRIFEKAHPKIVTLNFTQENLLTLS